MSFQSKTPSQNSMMSKASINEQIIYIFHQQLENLPIFIILQKLAIGQFLLVSNALSEIKIKESS